jgi:hypothetical protein
VLQRQGISSGVGPHWTLSLWSAAHGLLSLSSGRVMHWSMEVDLQLLRTGMARRTAVAPLFEHFRCTCGIAH